LSADTYDKWLIKVSYVLRQV